ncbi:MAG: tetratricopeptide repeat protein [Bacteroidota bacterium]
MIDYEKIERYCRGLMDEKERIQFEGEFNSNAELKAEVDFFRANMMDFIQHIKNEEERAHLLKTIKEKEGHFNAKSDDTKIIPIQRKLLRVAAVAAIILAAFYLFTPEPNLYAEYAIHEQVEIVTRGVDELPGLTKGVNAFNGKEYKEAIPFLQKYLENNSEDIEIQFTLGICYLETDQIEKALEVFNAQLQANTVFRRKALWYKSLTFLKSNDIDLAKETLRLVEPDSSYFLRAKSLLLELE